MAKPLDKSAMPCNKPRRTPSHPTSSHVVKACEDGTEKIIHFGQQGVQGSPKKAGESEPYRKRREAFKARHAKNIAKGKMSAAYWANRVKWAEGGAVQLKDYKDPYADLGLFGKLKELGSGLFQSAHYQSKFPSDYVGHLYAPDRYLEIYQKKHPEMGSKKLDRSVLDAAMNYAGAYDWAARPSVTPEDARSMAFRYQLRDYLWPGRDKAAEIADYWQNMAGVEQALKDREANLTRKRNEIAEMARKYALEEQARGRVANFAGGGSVNPVEAEVKKQFGMEPGLDRATFLPFAGRRSEGNLQWAVPGSIYELAKAYVLPGMAAKGYEISPEEATQFASSVMGGAGAGSAAAPVSGTVAGMAIKSKGGNWLKGNVENFLQPHRDVIVGMEPAERLKLLDKTIEKYKGQNILSPEYLTRFEQERSRLNRGAAINSWLDRTLAKYVKNEMGTPEDPLRLQIENFGVKKAQLLSDKDAQIARAAQKMEEARQSRGVTPEMLTQSQAQIRKLRKERETLAAQTGSHLTEDALKNSSWTSEHLAETRRREGFPEEGIALQRYEQAGSPSSAEDTTRMAQGWENLTDDALISTKAADLVKRSQLALAAPSSHSQFMENNPWLLKVPPETRVYRAGAEAQETGIGHMVDELKNAMNPGSDIPDALRLTPDELQKLTVPQAAKLVDDINAWRAVQSREADAARAGNIATQLVKDYPDQGMKWVEIKMPDPVIPEGAEMGVPSGYPDMHAVIDKRTGQSLSVGATPEEAVRLLNRDERKAALQDALKYEGEMLNHCVGGYCPNVEEGRSRIFSLRDAEGRPAATIETKPGKQLFDPRKPINAHAFFELTNKFPGLNSQYDKWFKSSDSHSMSYATEFWRFLKKERPEVWDYVQNKIQSTPQIIEQIKGLRNQKPAAEVIPMIQDFVKSGNWSDVKDIDNAELARLPDKRYITTDQFKAGLQSLLGDRPVRESDKRWFMNQIHTSPEWWENSKDAFQGFARGGAVQSAARAPAVYDEALVDRLAQGI